jgi:peptidase E
MGSGELTATMVEVHKGLLDLLPRPAQAVFLDTPAGFQLNCDQISEKAVSYFHDRVHHPLLVASLKSASTEDSYERQEALNQLKQADFTLIGPGSPSYAVKQWQQTPVPGILAQNVQRGGCLVAASAAALTIGRFTLPVYEIYKVGEKLHWIEGLNLLEAFGLNLVVVPHWNNAEGGTHDTRFCFMGESRFKSLAAQLPEDVSILGIDEHTACIIHLQDKLVTIKGLGQVTLQDAANRLVFRKGDRFPLDVLQGAAFASGISQIPSQPPRPRQEDEHSDGGFWEQIHELENAFQQGLQGHDLKQVISVLLELDSSIWRAHGNKESEEFISQARELLRDLVVDLGSTLSSSPLSKEDCLTPVIQNFLDLRESFRRQNKWDEADAVRNTLQRCGIVVEDTSEGARWRITN